MSNFILNLNKIKELSEKLDFLRNIELNRLLNEIKEYRLFGDLSENSEYIFAKKKKKEIENKIKNIEEILSNCDIKKEDNNNTIIKEITLKNLNNGKIIKYNIDEDCVKDLNNKSLSTDLSIINLIKGKNINDVIRIKKYNKDISFKLISIN